MNNQDICKKCSAAVYTFLVITHPALEVLCHDCRKEEIQHIQESISELASIYVNTPGISGTLTASAGYRDYLDHGFNPNKII